MIDVTWPSLSRNLIAIIRGITPSEVVPVGQVLADAGFEAIEVPLNSPDAFTSIQQLVQLLPHLWVGAGTVLRPEDVDRLNDVGGRLVVSPNIDPAVIAHARHHGMVTMPGVFSPTEALQAVQCGASALKFFPASVLGAKGIAAIKAVLPSDCAIGAVGGIDETSFVGFMAQGVSIFGLGTSIYRPGLSAEQVSERAQRAIAAYDTARSAVAG